MNEPVRNDGRGWARSGLSILIFNFAALLLLSLGLRLVLFLRFASVSGHSIWEIVRTFLVGGYRDMLVALVMNLPFVLWLTLAPCRWLGAKWQPWFLRVALLLFWKAQVFLLLAEFYFFEEFKSRFNTVAVDYLLYPHEVFINIWDTYPVGCVILGSLAGALALLLASARFLPQGGDTTMSRRGRFRQLAAVLASIVLLVLTLNSTGTRLGHERLMNEIAENGMVSFVTAAVTHDLDFPAFYRTLPIAEAYPRARQLLDGPGVEFTGEESSLQRRVAGNTTKPRLNVVIILEESFGSEFWGCLGRTNTLTPEMDRLAAAEGLLFANIYASGNRTVRGFEGVLSSFPPLPGESIVKRSRSGNVETIARVLKRDGYETVFLYGGRGIFDGMRHFTVNNGYDRFIEQKHFERATFSTIWGVCDEDLLGRALVECRALAATGRPFLATLMTVSNHKPYTYPQGRIPEDPNQRQRNHAVKYADHALGEFFRQARKEPFYTNTIFVVVADHGARVYGSQSIPIHSYEIPLLIVGPAVVKHPDRLAQLGCSLDVAPTVLGLLGRPCESLFFGRDLLKSTVAEGRVLIHHNRDIGMFRRDHMVVLGLNKTVEFYHGDPKVEDMHLALAPDAADLELEKDAIALFQAADDLYVHEQFRVAPSVQSKN